MYKKCFYTNKTITVKDLLSIIYKYKNYSIHICGIEGTMIDIQKDNVSLEILELDYSLFADDQTTIDDYINWLSHMRIYSDITTDHLISILEQHKDKSLSINGESDGIAIFIQYGIISLDYLACGSVEEALIDMQKGMSEEEYSNAIFEIYKDVEVNV